MPTTTATSAATAAADERLTFPLRKEHRSGNSGTVTVKGGNSDFTVTLAVKPKRDHPAHIHNVSCAEYRALKNFDAEFATVELTLSEVANRKSRTSVDTALSDYRTGGFAINVHS